MGFVTIVRYGKFKYRDEFTVDDPALGVGDPVIVRTSRGTEVGRVICRPRKQGSGGSGAAAPGLVLRRMTRDDLVRSQEIESYSRGYLFRFSREKAREMGLALRIIGVEQLFGEEKIIIYYTAKGRVDFRQLVYTLAKRFRSRIEMRQIGARDSTRICGGIGTCGRDLCCFSYMNRIAPVTIRMAKEQGESLNPSKNCGICGKLKCCLRFEYEAEVEIGEAAEDVEPPEEEEEAGASAEGE